MTKKEAAYVILKDYGQPLHVKQIIKIALDKKMITTIGKTPELTLTADLHRDNKVRMKRNEQLRFCYVGSGTWGLEEWDKGTFKKLSKRK